MKRVWLILAGMIAGVLLSIGIAEASGAINDTQRIHRYYDVDAGIVCYALTNKTFTYWKSLSCLPVGLVKDIK